MCIDCLRSGKMTQEEYEENLKKDEEIIIAIEKHGPRILNEIKKAVSDEICQTNIAIYILSRLMRDNKDNPASVISSLANQYNSAVNEITHEEAVEITKSMVKDKHSVN